MDGNQTEGMEVEASEHIDTSTLNIQTSVTDPSEETDALQSPSEDPFHKPEDDIEEGDWEGTGETAWKNGSEENTVAVGGTDQSDSTVVVTGENDPNDIADSSACEDRENMECDFLGTPNNKNDSGCAVESNAAQVGGKREENEAEMDSINAENSRTSFAPESSIEKNDNSSKTKRLEKKESGTSQNTLNNDIDDVMVVEDIEKTGKNGSSVELIVIPKEGDKCNEGDEEIVEVPVYKKPAEVVDLSDEEENKDKAQNNLEGNNGTGSDESNSDGNGKIKLRSLASLVDTQGDEPASTFVSTSHPDIPAIGEIVEHGDIIGPDEMDCLQLQISNVVGGEDCITGLTMDEDRDSFSSIQISSVTTLMEPMSPEDPNKEKPTDSEKAEATGEGHGEKMGDLPASSLNTSEDSTEKSIKIVNSESLPSTKSDKEDGDKSSKSSESEPQLDTITSDAAKDGGDDSQKVGCVYHVLRSILTVKRDCLVCGKSTQCEFRVTKKSESGTWAFLCSTECRTQWTGSLPVDHQVEKPRLIFEKLCGMCGKDLANVNRSGQFSWETREFCTRKCLTLHLKEVASECHTCHEEVRSLFIGKYCVRFGSDIHQFCSNSCLERYKTKIKVCCYCQKNLDKVKRVTSMANKEYCSMKCLKRAQRRDIGQQNYIEQHRCTVCVATGFNRYEFLANGETFQLCSDPCLNVYKYANKVKAVSCCLCFRVMNAEDVGHYLYHGGHQLRVFCSDSCVNVFILSARKIVICNYCKVKKYNFDMIHRQVDEDFRDYFYCSLNCLNTKEPLLGKKAHNNNNISTTTTTNGSGTSSETPDPPLTMCNMCETLAKPQYHMVMSDNTLRSFCRYNCASKYKTTFGFQINSLQNSDSAQGNNSMPIIRTHPPSQVSASVPESSETVSKSKKNAVSDSSQQLQASAELLRLLTPPTMANKMTMVRPSTLTKGVYCKPHPWHRYTQTEQSEADSVAPRSRGALTSSHIRELLDLDAQSDISSGSEVGGFSDDDSDSTVWREDEKGRTANSSRKRKGAPDLDEGARKALKLDTSSPAPYFTGSYQTHSPSPESCKISQQSWEWDYVSKFIPTDRAFDASSSGISRNCDLTEGSSEVDFFCLFFDQEIIYHVCCETNRYHQQNQKVSEGTQPGKRPAWHQPSVEEMYNFLGLTMLMAHIRKSTMHEYWTTDPLFNTPAFNQYISKNRFYDLIQFLHFVDDTDIQHGDKLAKIRPVLEHLRGKFKRTFKPFQNLSIEESLVLWRGRSIAKPYTPSKHQQFGIECYALTDVETGVIVDIVGCTGVGSDSSSSDLGYGTAVIKNLLCDYHHKNHVVYLDYWYSSPLLFEFLHQNGIGAVGAVRATRKCMPIFTWVKGECTASAHSHNMIAIKSDKQIHWLSTIHEDVMVDSSKSNPTTDQVKKKSKVVVDYRMKMWIDDHSDLMVTNTDCVKKSKKWYKKFFFHLLDIVVLNAYHLYLVKTGVKPKLNDFRKNVIRQLFERFPISLSDQAMLAS